MRSIVLMSGIAMAAAQAVAQAVAQTPPMLTSPSATAPLATPSPGPAPSLSAPNQGAPVTTAPAAVETRATIMHLSASLGDQHSVSNGLDWRIFQERAEADGSHQLVAETKDAAPNLPLPDGDYVVHVAFGLASAIKRVSVRGQDVDARLALNAGALKVSGMLGDAHIPASRLQISIYVPERDGGEARLVVADAKPGATMSLPEGSYRIISTYLDKEGGGTTSNPAGRPNATNSIVNAEVRVQTGKLTDVTLRHHAAVLTLKLVNAPGGEALANTSFSVLTPGGDVIRELIGAFPSLVLAEGEYVVIARRDGKTFQGTFTVQSSLDRDIEVLAK